MSNFAHDEPYLKRPYFALAIDPVHIGTGGYRLGRVDNAIIREPATHLPKIPGSSIAGVARAYTALAVQSENSLKMKYRGKERVIETTNPDGTKTRTKIYESCAGKGGDSGDLHCGDPGCEVCIPYGFSKKESSFQGLAQFHDARILFFPVHSMIGPIWITSPAILGEWGWSGEIDDGKFKSINSGFSKKLNFGWLLLAPDDRTVPDVNFSFLGNCEICRVIRKRAFLISDRLFSHIVNDNLEIRTSVAIDPATGAAVDGALYSYEAIPRGTILWCDVIYNNPKFFNVKKDNIYQPIPGDLAWVRDKVQMGLKLMKVLGVGGMNTRGMGRIDILNLEEGSPAFTPGETGGK